MTRAQIIFSRKSWDQLHAHHFPGDHDEHGSVLICGLATSERGIRLLVREVCPAVDGVDYLPGERSYRVLQPRFVAEHADRCYAEGLVYVAVHNHFAGDSVDFSSIDLASQERGAPALMDIVQGPAGWLVLGGRAVAGRIFFSDGCVVTLDETIVLGPRRDVLFPSPPPRSSAEATLLDDRQARLFGPSGQAFLDGLKVGVVGAGGAGSMIVPQLAHLGIGEVVTIDRDFMGVENRRRMLGCAPHDVGDERNPGGSKVDFARRTALHIEPEMQVHALRGDITDADVAQHLTDTDAIFLAADSMQSRLVVNAICHQYLIPGFQVGAKVTSPGGAVDDAFAVARVLGPGATCMSCADLINGNRLQLEALSPQEQEAARYVDEIPNPSVITMNAMSTAMALNDFIFSFTRLHQTADWGTRRYHFMHREPVQESLATPRGCNHCAGRLGRGDSARLPVRLVRRGLRRVPLADGLGPGPTSPGAAPSRSPLATRPPASSGN